MVTFGFFSTPERARSIHLVKLQITPRIGTHTRTSSVCFFPHQNISPFAANYHGHSPTNCTGHAGPVEGLSSGSFGPHPLALDSSSNPGSLAGLSFHRTISEKAKAFCAHSVPLPPTSGAAPLFPYLSLMQISRVNNNGIQQLGGLRVGPVVAANHIQHILNSTSRKNFIGGYAKSPLVTHTKSIASSCC